MGSCMSQAPEEYPGNINIDHANQNDENVDEHLIGLQDWNTDHLIDYIRSFENGKYKAAEYDTFATNLRALDHDDNWINILNLCFDQNILKDLGLDKDADIALIQAKCLHLYTTNAYFQQQQNENNNHQKTDSIEHLKFNTQTPKNDDDFFPKDWKFPIDENEQFKNGHYIGQRLYIRSIDDLTQRPSICIYLENNFIVVRYKDHKNNKKKESMQQNLSVSIESNESNKSNSILPEMNAQNIYKDMEKLHIIKDIQRITKMSEVQKQQSENENDDNDGNGPKLSASAMSDNIFEKDYEYYGMSAIAQCSSTASISGIVAPNCYLDPITYEIMTEPVTSKTSGRTYDKSMIMSHINDYGTDPFNQQPMSASDLFINTDMKRAIDRWLQNNPDSVTIE